MRLRNMLKICLVFCKSEPRYAYKRYAYKKNRLVQNAGRRMQDAGRRMVKKYLAYDKNIIRAHYC